MTCLVDRDGREDERPELRVHLEEGGVRERIDLRSRRGVEDGGGPNMEGRGSGEEVGLDEEDLDLDRLCRLFLLFFVFFGREDTEDEVV